MRKINIFRTKIPIFLKSYVHVNGIYIEFDFIDLLILYLEIAELKDKLSMTGGRPTSPD